jgi:hypothetical protein
MNRRITRIVVFLFAMSLAHSPATAASATLGGRCTQAQWGTVSGDLVCARTAKGKFSWVQLPPATLPDATSDTAPAKAPTPSSSVPV